MVPFPCQCGTRPYGGGSGSRSPPRDELSHREHKGACHVARPRQSGWMTKLLCVHDFRRRSYHRISKSPVITVPIFGGHPRYVWLFRPTFKLFMCITIGRVTLLSNCPTHSPPHLTWQIWSCSQSASRSAVTNLFKTKDSTRPARLQCSRCRTSIRCRIFNQGRQHTRGRKGRVYLSPGRHCHPQCRSCADETVDTPSRAHQRLIYGPDHDSSPLPSRSGNGAPSA